jgi:hypothetical protein
MEYEGLEQLNWETNPDDIKWMTAMSAIAGSFNIFSASPSFNATARCSNFLLSRIK